jgi:hypothetical protein
MLTFPEWIQVFTEMQTSNAPNLHRFIARCTIKTTPFPGMKFPRFRLFDAIFSILTLFLLIWFYPQVGNI